MTSYSTHGTSRLALIDGSLHYDDDIRAEQIEQITGCIASGVMRALLNTVRDMAEPDDANIYAEQWHSEAAGWEINALSDADRPALMEVVNAFVTENTQDILDLGSFIAWQASNADSTFKGDTGMGIYRVGMHLGYCGAGTGIGFSDSGSHPAAERLSAWVDARNLIAWEEAFIDSTEEPCLAHLG